MKYSDLPKPVQDDLTRFQDSQVRPVVLDLVRALKAAGPVLRAARTGKRAALTSLDQDEVVATKTDIPGASPLTAKQLLLVLDGIEAARRGQFGEEQQDLLYLVCGLTIY